MAVASRLARRRPPRFTGTPPGHACTRPFSTAPRWHQEVFHSQIEDPSTSAFLSSYKSPPPVPQTLTEKIFQLHSLDLPKGKFVRSGDFITLSPHRCMTVGYLLVIQQWHRYMLIRIMYVARQFLAGRQKVHGNGGNAAAQPRSNSHDTGPRCPEPERIESEEIQANRGVCEKARRRLLPSGTWHRAPDHDRGGLCVARNRCCGIG